MKNKEIKALKQSLLIQLPLLTQAELNELLNKKTTVSIIKLASRTNIFCVNDIPMFFDKDDRENYYPTILFLWKFPHAIRNFVIHSPVSDYLLNGADLMLPGLITTKSREKFRSSFDA